MTTSTITVERTSARATLSARLAATAWLNAFLATGQDDARPALYRALSVEFFPNGVQFIATDGTILLRTWAGHQDAETSVEWPDIDEAPDATVVVMDHDKFAIGFIRAALAAAGDMDVMPLTLAIEPAETPDTPLGEAFAPNVLSLTAFGQRLNCRLYESPFPDWRRLQLGLDPAERVSGMTIAPRMFATLGKIRDAIKIDCEFSGQHRQIDVVAHGIGYVVARGLVMPMRREDAEPPKRKKETTADDTLAPVIP